MNVQWLSIKHIREERQVDEIGKKGAEFDES
jgi:hypothetical protein